MEPKDFSLEAGKISFIKKLRIDYNIGLKEAKDEVEKFYPMPYQIEALHAMGASAEDLYGYIVENSQLEDIVKGMKRKKLAKLRELWNNVMNTSENADSVMLNIERRIGEGGVPFYEELADLLADLDDMKAAVQKALEAI